MSDWMDTEKFWSVLEPGKQLQEKGPVTLDIERTFVTSDHHFGSWHLPVLSRTTREDDERHIEIWNSVVGKDDLVLYVGDFFDAQGADLDIRPGAVKELADLRCRLNGRIVLIAGNHEMLDWDVYYGLFDDFVEDVVIDKYNVKLIHEPEPDRMLRGGKTIYGHIHEATEDYPDVTATTFCCCAMRHGWKPVRLSEALLAMDRCG